MGQVANISLTPIRVLLGSLNAAGYVNVGLTKDDGMYRKERVHILVASIFLKKYDDDLTVDHIDRNRCNNKVTNLRWVNWSEQNINRKEQVYKGRQRCC
jgi:hypothetical protein